MQIGAAVSASCEMVSGGAVAPASAGPIVSLRASTPTGARGTPPNQPLYVVDGVIIDNTPPTSPPVASDSSPFGFAVSCSVSCTRVRASDGTDYWKYDGYPAVIALRDRGPAAVAGIRVGDTIAEIDGTSILQEQGALKLLRSSKNMTMRVTVVRDGKRTEFLLRAN